MSVTRHHAEWLSLVEVSGPFLSMPVLLEVFPEGLDQAEDASDRRERLHTAFEEWLDDQGGARPDPAIHQAWVRFVLREVLDLDETLIATGQALPANLAVAMAEHGEVLRPAAAVLEPEGRPNAGKARLLLDILPREQGIERALEQKPWKASPATRMMTLLHGTGVRLGLVTNGEQWMLVHAKPGETTSNVSFYSNLFFEEPLTLRAFMSLCGAHRLFGVPDPETLEALFDRSSEAQQELTDQLGYQVRRAVEVLVQSIDRIDRDRQRELLRQVVEKELYEAACTVMMRLVFLLAAEERKLLLLGDSMYDQHYAVSTLRDALQEAADKHGKEVLRHRYDAFARLLSTFRAVHAGVRHDRMRLPAYGGSLFDPDRYPFLEGRAPGTKWREAAASPLPIDNLTVLDLLTAIQVLEVHVAGRPAEARRLSFRALDVEQIGHVYEGLLDHTAKRAHTPIVSLSGAKNVEPEVALDELESARKKGQDAVVELLRDLTKRSPSAIERALGYEVKDDAARRLLTACDNARPLYERVKPWAGLVRKDAHEQPVVYSKGAVYVTEGLERRATGTHYTPPSLTEPIVRHALEPLVYEGPAEGREREQWKLRSARELLALRVCDPAMGSGAFLVQACRYLAARLVEAWEQAERDAGGRLVITPEGELSQGRASERPLPRDAEERLAIARRVVADRCLFGVDKNPMATEMGKLSLWLVTLQKDRPFTFVDHALRSGDSLLGLTRLEQIEAFHVDPPRAVRRDVPLFDPGRVARKAVERAMLLRQKLESFSVESMRDAEEKSRLLAEATAALGDAGLIADLIIGAALATASRGDRALDAQLEDLAPDVMRAFGEGTKEDERLKAKEKLAQRAQELLDDGRGPSHPERTPFHWVLEFPEVLASAGGGFDAFVGNPPFMHGSMLSGRSGEDYADHLRNVTPGAVGKVDQSVFFLRRAASLSRTYGTVGLLITSKAREGSSRAAGFDFLAKGGFAPLLVREYVRWPGAAKVLVSLVVLANQNNGEKSSSPALPSSIEERVRTESRQLMSNDATVFLGAKPDSLGFTVDATRARELLSQGLASPEVLRPYFSCDDLNAQATLEDAPRFIIDFSEVELEAARQTWPGLLAQVEERVKPHRLGLKRKSYRERWWQFTEPQLRLFRAIRGGSEVIVIGRVSAHFMPRWAPSHAVFSDKVVCFTQQTASHFAVLASNFHNAWAFATAGTHGSGTAKYKTYNAVGCGRTYPWPAPGFDVQCGEPFRSGNAFRKALSELYIELGAGPTSAVGALADERETRASVMRVRQAIEANDRTVGALYGLSGIDLQHGIHDTQQGARFTISARARREVLECLLELNHERYAEEVRQGLHESEQPRASSAAPKSRRTTAKRATATPARAHQMGFGFSEALLERSKTEKPAKPTAHDEASVALSRPAHALLKACEKAGEPVGKAALLEAAKVDDGDWATAIRELLDAKLVRQTGEGRATKYGVKEAKR